MEDKNIITTIVIKRQTKDITDVNGLQHRLLHQQEGIDVWKHQKNDQEKTHREIDQKNLAWFTDRNMRKHHTDITK